MRCRALLTYGSTLSLSTRRPDSAPDRFALVDNLEETLRELHRPLLARVAHLLIPPITLSVDGAKLSLITPAVAGAELAARRDLYLAGRLSKRLEIHHGELDALVAQSVATVVEVAALGLGRRTSLEDAILRCLAISYLAEVRPERPDKPRALFDAFPEFYRARFSPLVEAHARGRGILVENGQLYDARPDAVRAAEARQLRILLRRSKRRAVLRWPQQLLIFRGSARYVLAKLRRAWS